MFGLARQEVLQPDDLLQGDFLARHLNVQHPIDETVDVRIVLGRHLEEDAQHSEAIRLRRRGLEVFISAEIQGSFEM